MNLYSVEIKKEPIILVFLIATHTNFWHHVTVIQGIKMRFCQTTTYYYEISSSHWHDTKLSCKQHVCSIYPAHTSWKHPLKNLIFILPSVSCVLWVRAALYRGKCECFIFVQFVASAVTSEFSWRFLRSSTISSGFFCVLSLLFKPSLVSELFTR